MQKNYLKTAFMFHFLQYLDKLRFNADPLITRDFTFFTA